MFDGFDEPFLPDGGRDGETRGACVGCARFVTANSGVTRKSSMARCSASKVLFAWLRLHTHLLPVEHRFSLLESGWRFSWS